MDDIFERVAGVVRCGHVSQVVALIWGLLSGANGLSPSTYQVITVT